MGAVALRAVDDAYADQQGAGQDAVAESSVEPTREHALGVALRALRGAITIEQIYRMVPVEICRCGFKRAWLSALDGENWRVVGFHSTIGARRGYADAVGALVGGSDEAEVVRCRRAALINRDSGANTQDPVIAGLFAPQCYVAAPLVVDTRVVAILHADRPGTRKTLKESDRDVLAIYAEAATYALQRAILAERLEALRRDVRSLTQSVGDLVDERCSAPIRLAEPERAAACVASAAGIPRAVPPPSAGSRLETLLTSRELEVLRLMASGETNAGIAEQLVISPGTVKSHVKNVLRKLHATNRAQAVSRYFRLARVDRDA